MEQIVVSEGSPYFSIDIILSKCRLRFFAEIIGYVTTEITTVVSPQEKILDFL